MGVRKYLLFAIILICSLVINSCDEENESECGNTIDPVQLTLATPMEISHQDNSDRFFTIEIAAAGYYDISFPSGLTCGVDEYIGNCLDDYPEPPAAGDDPDTFHLGQGTQLIRISNTGDFDYIYPIEVTTGTAPLP